MCEAPDVVRCADAGELDPCGGCLRGAGAPGEPCDRDQVWQCDPDEGLVCAAPGAAGNLCGGAGLLDGVPGEACGPCATGRWRCADANTLECDGALEAEPVWYPDADRDGFGDDARPRQSCLGPVGHTMQGGDCDDASADRYPGARERCDEADDDCDGEIDEEAGAWFLDGDEDGWGAGEPVFSCEVVPGRVDRDGDCDDEDRARNPGMPEVCHDGVDNDCDGTPNQCGLFEAVVGFQLADASLPSRPGGGANAGRGLLAVGHVGGAGGELHIYEAPVFGGPEPIHVILGPARGDRFGHAVVDLGDMDGDGASELAVSATGADNGVTNAGSVYVFRGPATDAATLDDAMSRLTGQRNHSEFGDRLAAGGDLDGDGVRDLVVGAHGDPAGGEDAGAVYVFRGPTPPAARAEGAYATILGGALGAVGTPHTHLGTSVAADTDLNGDGAADLAVGADQSFRGGHRPGAVHVFFGPLPPGVHNASEAQLVIRGWRDLHYVGRGLAAPGDVNGDGADDLVVATATELAVFHGPLAPGALTIADATAVGAVASVLDVAAVGDINGDGLGDLVLLEIQRVYLLLSPITPGPIDIAALPNQFIPDGIAFGAFGLGDLNGDGADDFGLSDQLMRVFYGGGGL